MKSLSIAFSGNSVRLLGMDASGSIVACASTELGFDFSSEAYFSEDPSAYSPQLSSAFADFLANADPQTLKAGALIDTSMAFITVMPVDFGESREAVESHILWELSNYYPDTYKDFSKKYYRLNNLNYGEIDEAIVIAIDKKKIKFISNLCLLSGIKLRNVEIGHFAVEKLLSELYGRNLRAGNVIVTSCTNRRIDSSLLSDSGLRYFEFDLVQNESPVKTLVRQLIHIREKFPLYEIPEVFVYGDSASRAIANDAGKYAGGLKLTHLNVLSSQKNPADDSSIFAPLAGLALKNLTG